MKLEWQDIESLLEYRETEFEEKEKLPIKHTKNLKRTKNGKDKRTRREKRRSKRDF